MKYTTALFFLLALHTLSAQAAPKNVDSRVTRVTVFPAGAQVTRIAHTSVAAGRSELVFGGISPYADASSIQVAGEGAFTILSVSTQPNKLKEQKKRKEIEDIERSKEAFDKQMTLQRAMLDVYEKEEKMLDDNNKIGGENVGLKATDLAAALDLHRTRLRELKLAEIDYTEKIKKIQDTLNVIDAQIRVLNNNTDISTTDLVVSIEAGAATGADFTLNYVVNNAGWYPSYDLHVDDINAPLKLKYKANVYQNTGEEWKDVRISFSNGNPDESGIAPELLPLYLRNIQVYKNKAYAKRSRESVEQSISTQDITNIALEEKAPAPAGYLYKDNRANVNYSPETQASTSITFELAAPYTVINDGQNRAVDMKEQDIPATFEYFCVPKKEKKAYLIAHVTNWLDYNLMDGEVNLYYGGTYTGKTAFSLANADDTLNLSLGHDKGITINRVQNKDFNKKQILSDKKSSSTGYEITVRNNKKFPITINVEDQIPISTDKDITIDNSSYEGGQLDEATGKVTWRLNLEPGKEKKVNISYTVKYPKTYRVQIN
jgi:uncharacterized protein (TIGR02231 family)